MVLVTFVVAGSQPLLARAFLCLIAIKYVECINVVETETDWQSTGVCRRGKSDKVGQSQAVPPRG